MYDLYKSLIQVSNGTSEIPLSLVPLTDVIGDGPELQEGDTLIQTGIMKRSAFHAFNNGGYILLIPFYTFFVRADLVDGKGPDGGQAGKVQPALMWIDQQAVGKGEDIGCRELQVEDGLEGPVFVYSQISQRLFFYNQHLSCLSGNKAAGYPGLYNEVRPASANLAHERIDSGNGTDAGEEHVDLMAAEGISLAFSGMFPGTEQVNSRLNLKACGSRQQDVHDANIRNH